MSLIDLDTYDFKLIDLNGIEYYGIKGTHSNIDYILLWLTKKNCRYFPTKKQIPGRIILYNENAKECILMTDEILKSLTEE